MPFKYKKATSMRSPLAFLDGGLPRVRLSKAELSPAVVRILRESEERLDLEGVRRFSKADIANFFDSL